MPMDYHGWDAVLECYQKYIPKLTNIADVKHCFGYDME